MAGDSTKSQRSRGGKWVSRDFVQSLVPPRLPPPRLIFAQASDVNVDLIKESAQIGREREQTAHDMHALVESLSLWD